jgi:hypothetical protein
VCPKGPSTSPDHSLGANDLAALGMTILDGNGAAEAGALIRIWREVSSWLGLCAGGQLSRISREGSVPVHIRGARAGRESGFRLFTARLKRLRKNSCCLS